MALRDELLNLERGFWKAAGDPDYYREHMADDGIAVFAAPAGFMNKDQAVASTTEGSDDMRWDNVALNDVRAIVISSDVIALTYTAEATHGDKPYSANATSIYAERDGRWQLVLHQQSENAGVPALI